MITIRRSPRWTRLAAAFLAALLGSRASAVELKFQTDEPVLLRHVQFVPPIPQRGPEPWKIELVNETRQPITIKVQPNRTGDWLTLTAGPDGGKASAQTAISEMYGMNLHILPSVGAPKDLTVTVTREVDTKTITVVISVSGTPI